MVSKLRKMLVTGMMLIFIAGVIAILVLFPSSNKQVSEVNNNLALTNGQKIDLFKVDDKNFSSIPENIMLIVDSNTIDGAKKSKYKNIVNIKDIYENLKNDIDINHSNVSEEEQNYTQFPKTQIKSQQDLLRSLQLNFGNFKLSNNFAIALSEDGWQIWNDIIKSHSVLSKEIINFDGNNKTIYLFSIPKEIKKTYFFDQHKVSNIKFIINFEGHKNINRELTNKFIFNDEHKPEKDIKENNIVIKGIWAY